MSYLVFARKWRPQGFEEVLAQDHITVTLRNAIKSGRIGHAYLFTGPRGVGKTTTARILAKALNCEKGPTPDPCRECPSCRAVTAGTDLDVLEIDGASNRGIDEIRDLRERAGYSAAGGRWKIYIIDEVHALTRDAFNALLKILEEPPPQVLFVFATTEPRKVPATIVSRCQRFDFRRIPASQMAGYLAREAAGEGIEIDPEALAMVTRASGGSLRDALSMMDQLVSFSGGRITRESASSLLRVVQEDILSGLASAMLGGKPGDALDILSGAFAMGYSVEELTDSLVEFLRNLMLAASGGEAGLADLAEAELESFRRLAATTCDTAVLDTLRIITAAAFESRQSSQPRIVLESAVMTASRLRWAVGLDSLPRISSLPVPAEPTAPSPAGEERRAAASSPAGGKKRSAAAPRREETASKVPAAQPAPEEEQGDGSGQGTPEDSGGLNKTGTGAGEESPAEGETARSLLDLFDAVSYD